MTKINIKDAERDLCEICNSLIEGKENCFLIEENNKVIAKIVPYQIASDRIGTLEGKITYNDHFDDYYKEITDYIYN